MKRSIVLLLALALFMIPSVAFADASDITMVVEQTDEESVVDKITEELLKEKNAEMEKQFKETHPELYNAFKKTSDTPYGFNMNINVTANIDFADPEMAQMLGFRRVFAKADMNGYINLPAEAIEMKMNMALDAGSLMSQSVEGIEILLTDDKIYTFDPTYGEWSIDDIDSSDIFDVTGNPMDQNQLGYMAPIANRMEKRETADSTIYSVKLTDEDIKTIVDEYAGMAIYDELVAELTETGFSFEIPEMEVIYVIQDGVIRLQHTEFDIVLIMEEGTIRLNIASDGEFYSYGLQKEVVKPKIVEQTTINPITAE